MDSQINALSERVARLEKANRAMKMILAVMVLAVVAMTSTPRLLAKTGKTVKKMAALDAGVITAHQINLVNGSGQIVAVLGSSGNSAGLVFVDNLGKWLLALGATQGGSNPSAGLALFDGNSILPGNGVARAAVGISSQGAAMTAMSGDGKPALISGIAADSSSAGSFVLDGSGFARAGFGNASNGSGFFANDSNNVTRYVAGVSPDGTQAGSVTFDATGKPQLALGGNGDGSAGGMVALDGTGQDRFDAGFSSADGGGLVVKDGSGNVTWYAPEPTGQ
ncbi:MAG: hypothetical protein ACREQH_11540 [Candidatus Binatus sp.]